jgi:predicted nucleic acid-binding protein
MTASNVLVFDDGPLSHFAEAGWLGLLKTWAGARTAWLPETVRRELGWGVDAYPHLRAVLEAPWLVQRVLDSATETALFGVYSSRLLGPNNENLGECGVLALAEAHNAVAVIDDRKARIIAKERKVNVTTTVSVLCDLVNDRALALDTAAEVADALLETEYRLPFKPGEFKMWVIREGMITDPYGS